MEDPLSRLRLLPGDDLTLAGQLRHRLALMIADGELEERIFRWVNEAPDFLYPPWWALMQYGTFITIPLATLIAVLLRRIRLAGHVGKAGQRAHCASA